MGNPSNSQFVSSYETTMLKLEEDEKEEVNNTLENTIINVYPNTFVNHITIEYYINSSDNVSISVYNNCALELVRLKNKQKHEAGTYFIVIES